MSSGQGKEELKRDLLKIFKDSGTGK